MKKKEANKKVAFTLAEVLITLGIIGVVAAMTMPTLINNMNNRQYISGLKKTYSLLTQITTRIIEENGSLKNLCNSNDNNCIRDIYKQHLRYVKECDKGSVADKCFSSDWKRLNGYDVWGLDDYSALVLNDGTSVMFLYNAPECDSPNGTLTICGDIVIDVNGLKGPNIFGKDIYSLEWLENRVIPSGSPGLGTDPNINPCYACEKDQQGFACAYEYITNSK